MLAPTGNTSKNKHKYLTQHHFTSRLAYLQDAWDPDLAEQLDRDFQRASSSAAKSVRHKPHAPFVTKLAKLCKEKNVLIQVLSQQCTGIDLSSSITAMVMISSSQHLSQNANNGVAKPNKKSESLRKIPSHFESKN